MKLTTKRLLILQSFVSNAVVIYPLYAIMFTERGGLSVSEVSVLFAIWTAAALIFELPTGLMADRYPRKNVLICGELINAAAFIVWLLLPSFWGYAFGFVVWGAAFALKSGAYQALVYDELAANNHKHEYTKMMSRIKGAEFSGMLVAFVGAYLISGRVVNYSVLLVLSALAAIVSAALLTMLPDVRHRTIDTKPEPQIRLIKRAAQVVMRNTKIRLIIAWLAIVSGFIGWYEEYTPLFDSKAGVATQYIPLVISAALVLNIIASLVAPKFESGGKKMRTALILGAGLIIIFATFGWWLPILVLLAHGGLVLLRILRILLDAELQHAAEGSVRATLGSVSGFLSYPVTISVALSFAALSGELQGFIPFRWIGITIIACGIALLVATKRSESAAS